MSSMKTGASILATAAGIALSVVFATAASASLIFDRGLPTTNLNNIAGANRSNVAWADVLGSGTTSIGDNFTLANSSIIDDIRVWVVSRADEVLAGSVYTLYLGNDAGPLSSVSTTGTLSSSVASTSYSDLTTYQASNGDFIHIFQVDFSGLNLSVGPGTYAFGIAGPTRVDLSTPFLHASNGPLSGSPQMGSDGLVYGFTVTGAMSAGYPFDSCCGNGWDKSSDINVQVFGSVPEPSSVALIAIALLSLFGLGWMRRRGDA